MKHVHGDLFVNTIRMSPSQRRRRRVKPRPPALPEEATAPGRVGPGPRALPIPGVIGDDSDDILGLVSLRRSHHCPPIRRAGVVAVLAMTRPRSETVPIGPLMVQLRDEAYGPSSSTSYGEACRASYSR